MKSKKSVTCKSFFKYAFTVVFIPDSRLDLNNPFEPQFSFHLLQVKKNHEILLKKWQSSESKKPHAVLRLYKPLLVFKFSMESAELLLSSVNLIT